MTAAPRMLAVVSAVLLIAGPPAAAQQVTVAFVGDVMLDEDVGREIAGGRDPLRAFASLLGAADLAVGNLECPVSTRGVAMHKPFTFRANPRVVPIVAAHLGAVTLANNHSGDYGRDALVQTMDLLRAAGVPFFGAGRDLAQAHAPLIVERGGLRIALLGYDEFKPRAFEAGPSWPGVAWSEDEQVVADIRTARAMGADVVIPVVHWGWEKEPEPCARQRDLARRLIDAGADAVVGGHPHITQGAEVYRGRPIVYSLGNFVFSGFDEGPCRTGWMLRLVLDRQGVARWDTVVARIDARGTPRPDTDAASPCGARGEDGVATCRAGRRQAPNEGAPIRPGPVP
jgi:poly-gamma-glutamate synthesis protein (capsule biosynthesis protein)